MASLRSGLSAPLTHSYYYSGERSLQAVGDRIAALLRLEQQADKDLTEEDDDSDPEEEDARTKQETKKDQ